MEDNKSKPLRSTVNKMKGIYDTYMKNQDGTTKMPDIEEDTMREQTEQQQDTLEEEILSEEEISKKLDEKLTQEDNNSQQASDDDQANESSEIGNLREQLLRKTAEMENMKRRMNKEKQDIREKGAEDLLQRFLELPDDMDNALNAAKQAGEQGMLVNGVKLINKKIEKLLSESGVTKMDINPGDDFDVEYHEALMTAPNQDIDEGKIVQVVQNGYVLKGKVLRHAKVITSLGSDN